MLIVDDRHAGWISLFTLLHWHFDSKIFHPGKFAIYKTIGCEIIKASVVY